MNSYIVTGASGFIGKRLSQQLSQDGHAVHTIGSLEASREFFGTISKPRADPIETDGVFHLGAVTDTLCKLPWHLMQHNVNNTFGIFQWCAMRDIPLVYASSASTYGAGEHGFSDYMEPENLHPTNLYGWSKNLTDRMLVMLAMQGMQLQPPKWYGLKFFNVYGPGEHVKDEMTRSFVFKAIDAALKGRQITYFKGTEKAERDFVHVDDVIRKMRLLMGSKLSSAPSGLYNIGTGQAARIDEVIRLVCGALDCYGRVEHTPMPEDLEKSYQWSTRATLGKLEKAGVPIDDFRDINAGVLETISELQAQRKASGR